jgi:2-succinyl-6-hydroxy-2,4-cyclohexadiene-1-carboxylate synthase
MTSRLPRYPVLLHGFAGSASEWEGRLIDGLAAAGLAPVLVDLPGHGAAAGATEPEAFTLDAALARIEAAGRWPADLIGYSMGGRLALHFAAAYPNLVRRLVLESASPGLETEVERAERRAADERLAAQIEEAGIEWFVENWESQSLFETRRRLDVAVRSRHRQLRLGNDPRSLAAALRGLGTGALPSLWEHLQRVALPTLLIVGELDERFEAVAERMAGLMPRARVARVPGAGHTVHLEAPATWLAAVVAFLTEGGTQPTSIE